MENSVTISTHNGSQAHRGHNLRDPKVVSKEPHIDPNGVFEIWIDEDPKKAYERIFGDAVREYNEKQAREERKIKSYYSHVCNDAKKHPVYEMIIGIYGKKEDGSSICSVDEGKRIMRAFVEDWKDRNPSLELIGAYYHADEAGQPHVHLDYIPVARGYSRGMQIQNGIARALHQQGFIAQGQQTEQIQWEARENQVLGRLCCALGLTVAHPGSMEHLKTEEFKARRKIEELKEQSIELTREVSEKMTERESVQAEIDTMKSKKLLSEVVQEAYHDQDHAVEILKETPEKKILNRTTPATVTIYKSDYEDLRARVLSSDAIRRAMEDLKRLGSKITRQVDEKRRIKEAEDRADRAEQSAEDLTVQLSYARADVATARSEIREQRDWMESQIDRQGYSLWDRFMDFITRQRERDEPSLER